MGFKADDKEKNESSVFDLLSQILKDKTFGC